MTWPGGAPGGPTCRATCGLPLRPATRALGAIMTAILSVSSLLHVAHHVAVQENPNEERTVDLLEVLEDVGVGYLDLDPEVLLLVDVDGLGEPKRGCRRRLAVGRELAFGVRTGPRGEQPGRGLDHDLLADVERRDGVVEKATDDGPAVVPIDLLPCRRFLPELVQCGLELIGAQQDDGIVAR